MKRVFIILVLVALFYLYRYKKNDVKESFFTHLNSDSDPRIPTININRTQNTIYEISKLFDDLTKAATKKELNQSDVVLNKTYTKATIPPQLRKELDVAVSALLKHIDQYSGKTFRVTYYENVSVKVDKNRNHHFVADIFVMFDNGLYKEMNMRLQVDFIKYSKDNIKGHRTRRTCSEVTTPAFRKYPYIGYPVRDQYIPLPTQVIPTGREVLSNLGVNYYVPLEIKGIHLNRIQIMNSTLHLYAENIKCVDTAPRLADNKGGGVNDNVLDYSFVNFNNQLDLSIDKSKRLNEWVDVGLKWKHVRYPYFKHPEKWDSDGIYKDHKRKGEGEDKRFGLSSVMNNNDYETVNKHPFVYELPRNSGENHWLFDKTRGNMGSNMGGPR